MALPFLRKESSYLQILGKPFVLIVNVYIDSQAESLHRSPRCLDAVGSSNLDQPESEGSIQLKPCRCPGKWNQEFPSFPCLLDVWLYASSRCMVVFNLLACHAT